MDCFKTVEFHRWLEKNAISDSVLVTAIEEMNQGSYEANLGGNVYKKRISLGSKGKSGGARTILAFKVDNKAFFIYGFTKNKRDNIDEQELKALKRAAKLYLGLTHQELVLAVSQGKLIKVEVKNG